MTGKELVDGVHRIEFVVDRKLHAFHLVETAHGLVLFDTGLPDTLTEHFEPYLDQIGYDVTDIQLVLFTHADADHVGSNHKLREEHPSVTFASHTADAPLIESADVMMEERYNRYSEYGIEYDPELIEGLEGMLPDVDEPVDIELTGGECLPVAGNRSIQIYHTPGHTDGHVIGYDYETDVVIGGDAIFSEGTLDVDGEQLQPPPYLDAVGYRNSIALIDALDPSSLLFTHFEPLHGEEIDRFLEQARNWTDEFESLLEILLRDADSPMTVPDLIDSIVERRGSFGADLDLALPIMGHITEMTRQNTVERVERGGELPAFRYTQ